MPGWMFGWWIRIAWWTPEARARRALLRYGECLYCQLALSGLRDDDQIEDVIQRAFLALHLEYVAGRRVSDPRRFALDFAQWLTKK